MSTDPKGRRLQACDECRRRKGDSSNMPDNRCTPCRNYGIECLHTKSGLKRGPKLGSSRSFASQPLKTMVSDILKGSASEIFYLLDDKDTIWKIMTKLANHAVSLQQKLEQYQREHTLSEVAVPVSETQPNTNPENVDDINSINSLSNEFSRFRVGVPKKIHFGESSHMMLVMTALEHRKKLDSGLEEWQSLLLQTKRPEFWNVPVWLSLPEPDFPILVNAYFTQNNVFCPLLHRPSFERSISQGLHLRDPAFSALLLSVCAVGSRYTYFLLIRWFNQLPIKQSAFGQSVSLYHLQMYCLASVYLNMVTGPDIGWMLSGIAMRLAQERGTHRHTELWKRVFWMLVVTDTETSMLFGRPSATSTHDIGKMEPLPAFTQPPERPPLVAFWNCYLKLVEIVGFARQSLYSIRKSEFSINMGLSGKEWNQKAVAELDSALNKWIDSVPGHLRWDAQHQNDVFFSQSAILHSMYYWVQIQIHRRFIPPICANAARSCIRVVEMYLKQKFLAFGHFMHPLFGSAMVLAINLWRAMQMNDQFNARGELADIHKCIDMIRLYETSDIINTVMSVSRLLVSTPKEFGSEPTSWPGDSEVTRPTLADSIQQMNYEDVHSRNESNAFVIDEQDLNLPFYSSELGQLPIHATPDYGGSQGAADTFSLNYPYVGQAKQLMYELESQSSASALANAYLYDFPASDHIENSASLQYQNPQNPSLGINNQDWDAFMANVQRLLPTINTSENQGSWSM
ncbi:fungal-specific transcription factor domain-containing protein [Rhodocollybia butyracea]|uniref:Fungal-specific transcription factor domain-containing protein n=1 Tax=Rhodocollybia butyracea TaxID=206335 RepID=A0A9P5PE57_9AGAR|nr:fungal-specific transcription factor domain-containing protein [Rhodocollybia butyracea]